MHAEPEGFALNQRHCLEIFFFTPLGLSVCRTSHVGALTHSTRWRKQRSACHPGYGGSLGKIADDLSTWKPAGNIFTAGSCPQFFRQHLYSRALQPACLGTPPSTPQPFLCCDFIADLQYDDFWDPICLCSADTIWYFVAVFDCQQYAELHRNGVF